MNNSNRKKQYIQYMERKNVEGSNKASSYIRALELLEPILKKYKTTFADCANVYSIESVERITDLYEYILEQQRLEDDGLFKGEEPSSYWRNRYYSAALASYKEFLILQPYTQQLWDLVEETDDPNELTAKLNDCKIPSIEELVTDKNLDLSSKVGKDKIKEVKTRVNQSFFRELILKNYQNQCCVSGLNIPGVLIASHIVAWADDKTNRLNPTNGLCLSATYDAAFDRHLISFDEDYRLIFSSSLKEHYTNKAFQSQFQSFEGKQLTMPRSFSPDQVFLEKHRKKVAKETD